MLYIAYIPDFPQAVHALVDHLYGISLLDANLILVDGLVLTDRLIQSLWSEQETNGSELNKLK